MVGVEAEIELAQLRRELDRFRTENARLARLLELNGQDTTPAAEQMSFAVASGMVTMGRRSRTSSRPVGCRARRFLVVAWVPSMPGSDRAVEVDDLEGMFVWGRGGRRDLKSVQHGADGGPDTGVSVGLPLLAGLPHIEMAKAAVGCGDQLENHSRWSIRAELLSDQLVHLRCSRHVVVERVRHNTHPYRDSDILELYPI